jgi:hypothetical protein
LKSIVERSDLSFPGLVIVGLSASLAVEAPSSRGLAIGTVMWLKTMVRLK